MTARWSADAAEAARTRDGDALNGPVNGWASNKATPSASKPVPRERRDIVECAPFGPRALSQRRRSLIREAVCPNRSENTRAGGAVDADTSSHTSLGNTPRRGRRAGCAQGYARVCHHGVRVSSTGRSEATASCRSNHPAAHTRKDHKGYFLWNRESEQPSRASSA